MSKNRKSVIENPWGFLKQYTPARLALGRAGESIPTRELLQFNLAHARARDAVHSKIDFNLISQTLETSAAIKTISLQSCAQNRLEYLKRPDLGRKLSPTSINRVQTQAQQWRKDCIAIVVGDGLSASAIQLHSALLVHLLVEALSKISLQVGPIFLVEQARVAIGDHIGELLNTRKVIVLIGERPGLSNVESIGAYLTYEPRVGRNNSERNCISNICPSGLPLAAAAMQIVHLVQASLRLQISGVDLNEQLASSHFKTKLESL
jgi:ethanolamine ammonia-lyase small subunit